MRPYRISLSAARVVLPATGVVVCLAALFAGCRQDPLAYENFRQIQQNHSTQADVLTMLGDPEEEFEGHWLYERPNKHLIVLIEFDEDGLVSRKQWIDAEDKFWDDSEEVRDSIGGASTTR